MTDNEIIKALECCAMSSYPACRECPYHDVYANRNCITKRNADIESLINRQKAEIERLSKRVDGQKHATFDQQSYTAELYHRLVTAESEAIKEFAERFKKEIFCMTHINGNVSSDLVVRFLDNLVKEMTEENNG